MKLNEAIKAKINKILVEKDLTIYGLALKCNLTQSTVDSLVNGKSNNPKLLTIVRICDGLGITLSDFFADNIFNNIDRED